MIHYVDPGSKDTYCKRNYRSTTSTTKIEQVTCKDCQKIYKLQRQHKVDDYMDQFERDKR